MDCGGSCLKICPLEVRPVSILWSRSFPVAPGVYDAIGYVENQNADAGVVDLLYRFKLYDENNVLVTERDGRTFIGPNQTAAIFEGGIQTGQKIPKRTFFELEDGYQWERIDPRFARVALSVKDKVIENSSTTPRLSVVVANDSPFNLKGVEVAVILRDADDNAVAVSRTQIDNLPKQVTRNVFFTWLKPFAAPAVRIEVLPRINPFTIEY